MPKITLKSQGEKSVGVSYSKEEAGTGWLPASNDDSNNYDSYGEDDSSDCGLSVLPGAMLGFILSLYKLLTCMSGINIPILPMRKEA